MPRTKAKTAPAANPLADVKLYKVVGPNGEAIHGGDLNWSLPQDGKPGEWHHVDGYIRACEKGLHLTPSPIHFYVEGSRVFEAEWRGDTDASQLWRTGAEKLAVSDARLLREVDWGDFCVWFDGEHELRSGEATLSGNARATLYGNARATLYDNAQATLSDNAQAILSDNAQATLSDNARATLYDSAQATLYENAQATLYDNAQATATDAATVVSGRYHDPSVVVALSKMAAHVDRRGGTLVLRKAE